jgi:type I restriction enzyme R subunit
MKLRVCSFARAAAASSVKPSLLDVLRQGIKDSGCKFRLACFRPASGLNEETRRLHAANLFAVVRASSATARRTRRAVHNLA